MQNKIYFLDKNFLRLRNFICVSLFCCFSFQSFGLELSTKKFIICQQKRATGIHFRTIRIHKMLEGKSSKHVTIYTRQGQDEVVAEGKWLVFCEQISNQIKNNLEKYLWTCEEQKPIKVFYSERSS